MREQGRVKFFNDDRGFGFVRKDDGTDLFFHVSSCGLLLPQIGARVSFEVGANPRTSQPEAKSVAILDTESSNGT
jgi:cold shock protein